MFLQLYRGKYSFARKFTSLPCISDHPPASDQVPLVHVNGVSSCEEEGQTVTLCVELVVVLDGEYTMPGAQYVRVPPDTPYRRAHLQQ